MPFIRTYARFPETYKCLSCSIGLVILDSDLALVHSDLERCGNWHKLHNLQTAIEFIYSLILAAMAGEKDFLFTELVVDYSTYN